VTIVRTQTELDAAIAVNDSDIIIDSPRGAWINVGDSATVSAWDSATVRAWGSATVSASGSATVSAWGSATVSASDSATVSASGSATVSAWGSATVRAGSHCAVHLHSGRCTVEGGVLIDHTQLDLKDPATWCAYHGVTVSDGRATLYKALGDDLASGEGYRPTVWPTSGEVCCDDWRADNECGGGLHLSPTPEQSTAYRPGATRWLEVTVAVDSLRPICEGTPKCKAPSAVVLREVDRVGRPCSVAS